MLNNPNWDKPSVAGIIAFLGTRPADEVYDYNSCYECAAAQYMRSLGQRIDSIAHWKLWEALPKGAYAEIFRSEPWTYGAALERALGVGVRADEVA